jgi:DNA invertase Pin-like site-specific DNA recombinase
MSLMITSRGQNLVSSNYFKKHKHMQKEFSLIYTRVASVKQGEEGISIAGQEKRCRKFSDEKMYSFEKTFSDEGLSGATFDRPALKKMLQHIENNPGNKYVVIADDMSRVARDVKVGFLIKKTLALAGVKIEYPNYEFENTPEANFIETILAGKAQLDMKRNAKQENTQLSK